jgi:hypothetical protein
VRDDLTEDAEAEIRIAVDVTGRKDDPAIPFDRSRHIRCRAVAGVEEAVMEGEAGRVAEHSPDGGARAVAGEAGQPLAAEVVVHGAVELNASLLDELHHGRGGERLADRGQRVEGRRGRGDAPLEIGVAESLLPQHHAVARHRDGQGRDAGRVEQPANLRLQCGADGGGQRHARVAPLRARRCRGHGEQERERGERDPARADSVGSSAGAEPEPLRDRGPTHVGRLGARVGELRALLRNGKIKCI